MFSPAYPFAPLMGMVWNFLKLVVDVNSVSVSKKRTNESEADSIGAWNQILEVFYALFACEANFLIKVHCICVPNRQWTVCFYHFASAALTVEQI